MNKWTILITFSFIPLLSFSQIRTYEGNFLSVGLAYLELKDALNHGLVFRGPDVAVEYGVQRLDAQKYFQYSFLLAGGGKTTAGTWGFKWTIAPVNVHYSLGLTDNENLKIYLGPRFQANYSVYNYPDLHAGPILWMSSYDLGLNAAAFFEVKGKKMEIQLQNTLLAWSSRPDVERDPYFFSTKIGDNLSDIHRNMVFGSVDNYNETKVRLSLYLPSKKRVKALSYVLIYSAYYDQPRFQQLTHSIQYTWYFKKISL